MNDEILTFMHNIIVQCIQLVCHLIWTERWRVPSCESSVFGELVLERSKERA